jgi:diamine N-acetyltransferase
MTPSTPSPSDSSTQGSDRLLAAASPQNEPQRLPFGAMPDSSVSVSLREVSDDNVSAVIGLAVSPDQTHFVAPNVKSLAQAFATTKVWVRAVYADDVPVGFVMLSDDADKPRYYLWRFMIDQDHQGRGYGRQAMALVHEYVRSRPGGDRIYLSYVPAPGGPEPFYRALGYEDTGVEHGGELEAVLHL